VIVALVICTVWPELIEVLSRMISVPDVPTVSPVITSASAEVRILAAAAVPVASAVSDFGKPEKVKTPPDAVPQGSFNVIVARILAIPAVPISSFPAPEPASIAAMTPFIRSFFAFVE
jgi:hypothetical protein